MSNIDAEHRDAKEKRQINIRPIKMTGPDEHSEDRNDEPGHIRSEIDQAYEQLQRIKDEQSEVIKQTNAQIEAAKSDWEKEKQQYIEEAKHEGYKDGFEQGEQNGFEQYNQLLAEANNAVQAARKDYQSNIEQSDDKILELAFQVAEKIIHQQLSRDSDAFISLVQAAIKEVKDKTDIAIYVHPANYDGVVRQKDDLIPRDDRKLNLSVYVSDELNKGSCLIEHPTGQIDASADAQLQELRGILREISLEHEQ